MKINKILKASVAAAALFAVAVPVAEAGTVSGSNDTASVTLSGHFNYGVLMLSDGEATKVVSANNANSETSARIVATGKVNEAVSVSGVMEWGFGSNNSNTMSPCNSAVTTATPEVGTDSTFTERNTYVKFTHKTLGALTVGHDSDIMDGVTEQNMTGATDIIYGGNTGIGNGILLRTSTSSSAVPASATTVGAFIASVGNGGRQDVIKYQTPSFAGFSGGASFHANQSSGYAVTWGGKMGGFDIGASYGYTLQGGSGSNLDDAHGASIAIGHDSGLNLRVSGGVANKTASNVDHQWNFSVGGGYKADLISTGKTNFAFDWGRYENITTDADKMDMFAIGVEQDTAAGVQFYLGYQLFMAEQGAVEYDNASTVMAGTKVYF